MIVRCVSRPDIGEGFEYSFLDLIMEDRTAQNTIQVASAIEIIVKKVQKEYSEITEIVFQSDNASCFSSLDLIPFIYNLNKKAIHDNTIPLISKWIFTEAQTGRGRLDTHFSFVNLLTHSYVADGNDIATESDIFKAMQFNGGIAGCNVLLLNLSNLPKPPKSGKSGISNTKCNPKSAKSRMTKEVQWEQEGKVKIFTASNITVPETLDNKVFDKYTNKDLNAQVVQSFSSTKEALFVPFNKNNHPKKVAIIDDGINSSKAQCFKEAFSKY